MIVGPNPMLECRACCLLESLAVASAVVLYSSSYLCFPFTHKTVISVLSPDVIENKRLCGMVCGGSEAARPERAVRSPECERCVVVGEGDRAGRGARHGAPLGGHARGAR